MSGYSQTCELGWITNSREHEKLWSVEYPRTQDDLSTGHHLPPLTLCTVNKETRAIGLIDSLEDPVPRPNSTPSKQGVVEP